jgi:hypothetical protein
MKSFGFFILKTSTVFGSVAFLFSLIGLILPNTLILGSPLDSNVTLEHVVGHIAWGLVIGIVSFSLRYAVIAGLFPIILDFDHLLQFLDIEMISRMAHSIPFALLVTIIMILIFGKKDLRLIAISFAAIFAHISFDIFIGGGWAKFPLFAPITSEFFVFTGYDWIIFEVMAMTIVASASIIFLIKQKKKQIFSL